MKTTFLLSILAVLLLSSCGPTLTPFTQQVYEQGNFNDGELKRIQFYLSDDIVLRRELTGGRTRVVQGEIKIVNGRKVEQVVIPRGTPGTVVLQPGGNRLAVSFEQSDEQYLVFGPNPTMGDRYTLLASDQRPRFSIVTYGGKKWRVDRDDSYATLMVDLEKANSVAVRSRTAQGRTID